MNPTWRSIRAKTPHRAGAVAVTAAIGRFGPSDRKGNDEVEDFVGSTFRGALHFAGVYVVCDPRGADQTCVVKGICQKDEESVKKMLEALARLGYSDVETSGTLSEIASSVTAAGIEAHGDFRR